MIIFFKKMCTTIACVLLSNSAFALGDDCSAVIKGDNFVALFPMENLSKKWEWYKKPRTPEMDEYSWIVESGFSNRGGFKSNGVFMSFSIGDINPASLGVKRGDIDELLRDGSGSLYFSDKNRNKQENILRRKNAVGAQVDKGEVMVFTSSPDDIDFLVAGDVDALRLSYKSIDGIDNYSCIVDLIKLD